MIRKFVGGSADGREIEVEESRMYWRVAIPPEISVDCFVAPTIMIKTEDYRLMPFRGEKERHEVFALEGMSADEVIRRLIAGYKRP